MIEHGHIERLIEVRRYAEARELIERGFAKAPDDPELHHFAAQVALRRNDLDCARQHVGCALAAAPSHRGARVVQFLLLYEQRAYVEAEQSIVALLSEDPRDAELLALYARLMLITLHVDKAAALVEEALRCDPHSQLVRVCHVLIATARGRRSEVDATLAELVATDPEAAAVTRTLFVVLVERRRYREALAVGQELLRGEPDDADLVEALVEVRSVTHWAALPAYPLHRWGWLASGSMWGAYVVGIVMLGRAAPAAVGPATAGYLGYVVYSWLHRPLLRRWLRKRGI